MNKKGIERNTLLLLFLLVVAIVLLWPVLSKATVWAINYFEGGSCQASVALSSVRVGGPCPLKVTSPTALKCPKREIVIGENKATLAFKGKSGLYEVVRPDTGYATKYNIDGGIVNSIFAEEMRYCWEKFGEGEMWLFPEGAARISEALDFVNPVRLQRTVCHICSEISFEEGVTLSSANFGEYIKNTQVPGKDITYLSQFNNPKAICEEKFDNPPGCWSNLEKNFVTTERNTEMFTQADPAEHYAVVMARKGFQLCENKEKGEMSSFVYVVSEKDYNKLCDITVT